MKKTIIAILIALCLPFISKSQEENEKEVDAKITSVTVYLEDARITREKQLSVEKGKTTYKFTGLSLYIDPKSLQVSVDGKLTVLSVRHQHNFMNQKKKSDELEELSKQREELNIQITKLNTNQTVINDEMTFLNTNRAIGGANVGIDAENLQKAVTFYASRMGTLKSEDSKINREIAELTKELNRINNQMRILNEKTEMPTGEVLVEVSADAKVNATFTLSYLVKNAGWFPSYDIRVKNVGEPMEITYKANVRQNTNVDWKDVKLKFSSGNPSTSGVAPKLRTYTVGYNTSPPVYTENRGQVSVNYGSRVNQVFGTVYDLESNETLIGVNVMVKGTNIGAVTDMDGRYTLTIPPDAQTLVFSSVGYENAERPINSGVINVGMRIGAKELASVVVSASKYEQNNSFSDVYYYDGVSLSQRGSRVVASEIRSVEGVKLSTNSRNSIPVDVSQIEYQTNFEFEIATPYTILSNGKNLGIDMKDHMVDAHYQYFSIPKIEKEAYLTAFIKGWEKYNFMQGEANVFFEDTYVGKTLIDTRYLTDSLEISLGKDKNVMVGREMQKQFTSNTFLKNKKEDTRAWLVTIRNNKKQDINITVLDQVPVSNSSDVTVDLDELSGGELDKVTGELKWEIKLKPQEQTTRLLKYKVKYPDYWNTVVE